MKHQEILERTEALKALLVAAATGGGFQENQYIELRRELISIVTLHERLPDFLRNCRTLSEFWDFIKDLHPSYRERREFLRDAFNPLLNDLEKEAEGTKIVDSFNSTKIKSTRTALRVFVSHSYENRHQAITIKNVFETYGMEVFVAHEDIAPSAQWEEEILKYLRTTDLFVPILTNNFQQSKWTDQETGIAYEKGAEFFPLIVDMTPYGFIAKYQGMKCLGGVTEQHVHMAIDELLLNERVHDRLVDSLIFALGDSGSFEQSNVIANKLRGISLELNDQQVTSICRAWMDNEQVQQAYTARGFVFSLTRERKGDIDKAVLPLLEARVQESVSF